MRGEMLRRAALEQAERDAGSATRFYVQHAVAEDLKGNAVATPTTTTMSQGADTLASAGASLADTAVVLCGRSELLENATTALLRQACLSRRLSSSTERSTSGSPTEGESIDAAAAEAADEERRRDCDELLQQRLFTNI